MQYRRVALAGVLLLLVLALSTPVYAAGNGPDAPLQGVGGPKAIPGHFIVVMKPGTDQAATDAAIVGAKRAAGKEASSMSVHHR